MPAITNAFVKKVPLPNPATGARQHTYVQRLDRGLSLVLVVSYGGSRTFRVLTYRNGRPRTVKLGSWPQLTADAAKNKAREYFEDPKTYAAQAEVGTFKEIAENWFKRHVEATGLRSRYEIRRKLEKYVYPKWKDEKFLDIRRRQVIALLDRIADDNGEQQANAVLATIRSIMAWHQSRDDDYTSPIVKGMRRGGKSVRDRILDDDEIRLLWAACEVDGTFGALLKVLLLTAQRKSKVATMKWEDLHDGVWTIPKEDREKDTAGELKLPAMALEVIEAQPRIVGNPYVFPGRGKGPFHAFGHKAAFDRKLNIAPWVLHDLRRTARSLMSRAKVVSDHAERVLGHAIPGIRAVYDRHEFAAEKADALEKLAAQIDKIINPKPANVLPFEQPVSR